MADNFCNFLNLADQIRQSSFSTGVPSSQELASRNRPYCLLLSAVWWNTNYRWWQGGVCDEAKHTVTLHWWLSLCCKEREQPERFGTSNLGCRDQLVVERSAWKLSNESRQVLRR